MTKIILNKVIYLVCNQPYLKNSLKRLKINQSIK